MLYQLSYTRVGRLASMRKPKFIASRNFIDVHSRRIPCPPPLDKALAGRYSRGMITQEKWERLRERMAGLGIREEDLAEQFIRASGSGGQKVNKTSSCVQLRHAPSGIEIKCQSSRLQGSNRFFARRDLCDKLEARILGIKSRKRQEQEKVRRQKRRRSRRAKNKMLEGKHKQSEKKGLRRPVKEND
jgi:protein subunit release factor B